MTDLDREVGLADDILERANWSGFGSDEYPSAWEISDVGRQPGQGARTDLWIGKRAMLGSDWRGIKWLH